MSEIKVSDGWCLTPEGVDFEAKECGKILPESFWETYSSFCNTFGGTIALGLKEDIGGLKVVGVVNPENIKKILLDLLNDPKKVNVNLLSDDDIEVKDYGGKNVILVHVPRAPNNRRPVYVNNSIDNGTYRRNGESDYHCSLHELQEMFRDSSEESQDTKIIGNVELGDLEKESIRAYRNIMSSRIPDHPWNSESDDDFLRLIGAAGRDGEGVLHPTLAGLLMFGVGYTISLELPQYHLDYFELADGPDEWAYRLSSDSGEWSGNVFDFYTRVSNRIFTNSRKPFRLDGMVRVENNDLVKAQREMVLNGLIHADYRGFGGVRIELRPDSLFVRNPGSFRVPIDKAEAGGLSIARNVNLMRMFTLIGAVERAGSGICRIVRTCRELQLPPPSFTESIDPMTVSVRMDFEYPRNLKNPELNRLVKDLMRSDDKISIEKIAEKTSVSKSRIYRMIKSMQESGEVERIGGKRGKWDVRI